MTLTMPAPRIRRRLDRDVVRIIAALLGVLIAILVLLFTGIPEDWRAQGSAGCLFKDASGAMQMECGR